MHWSENETIDTLLQDRALCSAYSNNLSLGLNANAQLFTRLLRRFDTNVDSINH